MIWTDSWVQVSIINATQNPFPGSSKLEDWSGRAAAFGKILKSKKDPDFRLFSMRRTLALR